MAVVPSGRKLVTWDPHHPTWEGGTAQQDSERNRNWFGMLLEKGQKSAGKKLLIVTAADDAEEQQAHRVTWHMMNELLSGSTLSNRILAQFSVLYIPFHSLASVRDGFSRYNLDGTIVSTGGTSSEVGDAVLTQAIANWLSDHPDPANAIYGTLAWHCDVSNQLLAPASRATSHYPGAPYAEIRMPDHTGETIAIFRTPVDRDGFDALVEREMFHPSAPMIEGYANTLFFEHPWRAPGHKASFWWDDETLQKTAIATLAGIAELGNVTFVDLSPVSATCAMNDLGAQISRVYDVAAVEPSAAVGDLLVSASSWQSIPYVSAQSFGHSGAYPEASGTAVQAVSAVTGDYEAGDLASRTSEVRTLAALTATSAEGGLTTAWDSSPGLTASTGTGFAESLIVTGTYDTSVALEAIEATIEDLGLQRGTPTMTACTAASETSLGANVVYNVAAVTTTYEFNDPLVNPRQPLASMSLSYGDGGVFAQGSVVSTDRQVYLWAVEATSDAPNPAASTNSGVAAVTGSYASGSPGAGWTKPITGLDLTATSQALRVTSTALGIGLPALTAAFEFGEIDYRAVRWSQAKVMLTVLAKPKITLSVVPTPKVTIRDLGPYHAKVVTLGTVTVEEG